MQHFNAELLFDGESWQHDVSFSVDAEGHFIERTEPGEHAVSLGIVIPGFVNCHSHSFQRAMAGLGERISASGERDSFWSWRQQMYHLVQTMTPESFSVVANWLYTEMLEAGFTSVGEFHYLHNQPDGSPYAETIELSKRLYESGVKTGIRVCMLPVLYQKGTFGEPLSDKQLPFQIPTLNDYHQFINALSEVKPAGHQLGVAAHSLRGVDLPTMKSFAEHYNQADIPVHIHIAEQPAEVNGCLAFYSKRPVQLLLEDVGINQNWTLVHATHVNEGEVKGMADVKAVVGICPVTEANLGDGIFPMMDFLNQQGPIAIGSDSHVRIDPFEELRLIEYSQRYQTLSRACLTDVEERSPGFKLAKACYAGGNQSLKTQTGMLKNGFYADFIELDDEHPATLRRDPDTLWDELIFAAGREVVKNVYSNGQLVVRNGKHLHRTEHLAALKAFYQQQA